MLELPQIWKKLFSTWYDLRDLLQKVVGEVVGECRLRAARAEGDRLRDRCERRETR